MNRLLRTGLLFAIAGLALGCGDASQATSDTTAEQSESLQPGADPGADPTDETDGLDEADDLDAEDAADPVDPAAKGPKLPKYVGWVVYLQPSPSTPLYKDAKAFIAKYSTDNLATFFPPHISVTGFFNPSLSATTAINDFLTAYAKAGGAPNFGQPKIQPKVTCSGRKLVALKIKLPKPKKGAKNKYALFSAAIAQSFHLTGKKVKDTTKYHLTLFHSQTKIAKARFDMICSDAQQTFAGMGRLEFYNGPADRSWRAALFFSKNPVTATNPLPESPVVSRLVNQ